jgi:hypothetical protein
MQSAFIQTLSKASAQVPERMQDFNGAACYISCCLIYFIIIFQLFTRVHIMDDFGKYFWVFYLDMSSMPEDLIVLLSN